MARFRNRVPFSAGSGGTGSSTNASYVTMVPEATLSNETTLPSVIRRDVIANRGGFGNAGVIFISTDTLAIYRDSGTSWDIVDLGLSGYQPLDSDLTAIAAIATTAYGRAFLGLADAPAARTALALGTAATHATTDYDASGAAAAAQAAAIAASQPVDSDLTAIAALATTAYGRSVLTQADSTALRALAGAVIGTDVEAHDADLTTIAGLTPANDDFIQRKSGAWVNRTVAQVLADLNVPSASLAAAQIYVGSAGGVATARAVSGDISMGNTGSVAVNKWAGQPLNAVMTGPTTGDVPVWDGTQWVCGVSSGVPLNVKVQTYTPVLAQGASSNINKTIVFADFIQIGQLITVWVRLTPTATGSGGSDVTVSLPVPPLLTASPNVGSGTFNLGTFKGKVVVFISAGSLFIFRRTDDATTTSNVGTAPATGIANSGDAIDFYASYLAA